VPPPASIRGLTDNLGANLMTSFTFTAEQLMSAPTEVRQWVLSQIEGTVAAMMRGPTSPVPHSATLAGCTVAEAAQLFDLIRDDLAAVQVLFELGRDRPMIDGSQPLHALSLAEMIRHTRLDNKRLIECLQTINRAYQHVHTDAQAMLFGFDQANHIYIHEMTHRSLQTLWQELVSSYPGAIETAENPELPGFLAPHLGPSEDIAEHRRQ
jgi:hypothetical protein